MFCSNCGKPLIPHAAFCSNCGSRIAAAQSAAAPIQHAAPSVPPVAGAEETLFALNATRRVSMTHTVICDIVFKRNWFVLAHRTPQLTARETARLQESLKAQNLGVMKRSSAQMRFWGDFHKRYYAMATAAVLAEEPMNLVLNYENIAAADFACSYASTDEDSSSDVDGTFYLTLTNGETLRFTHRLRHDKVIKEMLTSLFGPRLRYKK